MSRGRAVENAEPEAMDVAIALLSGHTNFTISRGNIGDITETSGRKAIRVEVML